MENTKLLFCGTERSDTTGTSLQLYVNQFNEIVVIIDDFTDLSLMTGHQHICISRETAIKLSKELKKQISLLDTL